MKKLFFLILTLFLFAPSAFADTITVNLDTATVEELQATRDAIDARIAEIRSSILPSACDKFTLTGKGTTILEGLNLCYSPARLSVISSEEIKVTLCSADRNNTYDGGNSSGYQFAYVITKQQSISSIIVETQGKWSLEISPIELSEQMTASGSGSHVTDAFISSPPAIVSISFNEGWYGGYSYIYLYKIRSDGSVSSEEWMWQDIVSDESFDYVIKPEGNIQSYFIQIRCPHDTQWEITTK